VLTLIWTMLTIIWF